MEIGSFSPHFIHTPHLGLLASTLGVFFLSIIDLILLVLGSHPCPFVHIWGQVVWKKTLLMITRIWFKWPPSNKSIILRYCLYWVCLLGFNFHIWLHYFTFCGGSSYGYGWTGMTARLHCKYFALVWSCKFDSLYWGTFPPHPVSLVSLRLFCVLLFLMPNDFPLLSLCCRNLCAPDCSCFTWYEGCRCPAALPLIFSYLWITTSYDPIFPPTQ